jgi:hypothetical protein
MADGSFPTLVSKDTGANAVANPIWIQLTDGTAAVGVTTGALDVNIASGSFSVDFSYADDSVFTFTTSKVGAIGAVVDDVGTNSVTENNIGHVRMTPKAILLTTIADATTDTQRLAINASGQVTISNSSFDVSNGAGGSAVNIQDGGNSITVDGAVTVSATALDIRTITKASDSIQISKNTAVNSELNPIFVQAVKGTTSGDEVHAYGTSTGTGNNDYTVAGTTFLLNSVIFGASGGMKATVQTGPLATLVTQAVGFIPHQGGTQQLFFDPPIEVPVASTGTVRVIMTNREGTAMDVYSTIIGNDLP